MHFGHVALDVVDFTGVFRHLLGKAKVLEIDEEACEFPCQQVKDIYVAFFHTDEDVAMIFVLVCQSRRDVETTHFAGVWIGVWHDKLHLTVIQFVHIPQLQHVRYIYRDKQALVRHEGDMADFVIVRIINLLLITLE